MATIEIFLGSNNETGVVDRNRLECVLQSWVDGYTLRTCRGYWKGHAEPSVSVLTTIPDHQITALLSDIVTALNQQAVAWSYAPDLHFFYSELEN